MKQFQQNLLVQMNLFKLHNGCDFKLNETTRNCDIFGGCESGVWL